MLSFFPKMIFKLEIIFCFLEIFHGFVESKSQFSLKITKYIKYSFQRLDGKCCGDHGSVIQHTCTVPCIQRFSICLEYYHASVSPNDPTPYTGHCAYGKRLTEIWGDSSMKFNKESTHSYKFTIKSSWPGSITLIIEAYDTSETNPYRKAVIDRVVYKNFLKPSYNSSMWNDVVLSNDRSVYQFSMNLICKSDYYGEFCDRYCKNNGGHYKCDINGEKVCDYGWMGSDCNNTICQPGCHRIHGYCENPGECRCRAGWQGTFCDECMKYPGCKHGTCVDSPWTCSCENNWGGQFCDQSLNYCAENNPCKNGGICENLLSEVQPYKCICPSGFEGRDCEIDPCFPNPCKKGTCMKSKGEFYCQCIERWTGKLCDQDTSICDQNSCQNGGQCGKDENGNRRCICQQGYKGSECHLAAPCENSQCKHALDCQIQSTALGDYKCLCQPGYTGKYCDKEINECVPNPCKNNGVCTDSINDYKCNCSTSFKGKNCELNIACQNQPCKNGGVCQEVDTGYTCKCKTGYTGTNCEIYKTGCSPNPCLNGAYCYTINQDFYCHCNKEFWGKRCEHSRPYCGNESCESAYDACSMPQMLNSSGIKHNYCGKYGTCLSHEKEKFICRCMPGFEGDSCEIDIDDCKTNPCKNGGICIDSINNFECICDNGFFGKTCEERTDYCIKSPCMNYGVCLRHSDELYNDFICECKNNWGGRLCHLPKHSICDSNPCLNGGSCSRLSTLNGFQCHCNQGWIGTVCQFLHIDFQPCRRKNLCKNEGVCINVGYNDFTCHCKPGFEGKHCDINTNECNPNPCFNGGKCIDKLNSYRCICAKGFYGSNCQLNYDECASFPCAYGAICVDRIDDFECRCPEGRDGKLCDHVKNNESPQPPSCVYYNRIFDSGETWSYNCQNCACDRGKVTCESVPCGVWTCLQANGTDDPYACKPGEMCYSFPFNPKRCFVPPCVPKARCIKEYSIYPNNQISWPGESHKDCQPNSIKNHNYCAKIILTFNKKNVPIGITIDDICDGIKTLKCIQDLNGTPRGRSLGISCDINENNSTIVNVAIYSPMENIYIDELKNSRPFAHYLSGVIAKGLIDVIKNNNTFFTGLVDITIHTLLLNSDSFDRATLIKYLLVPIIAFGVLVLIGAYWYHRKKMVEIREKYANSTKINNNNLQSQPLNPVRSQYPIMRPTVQNKHLTEPPNFYERNISNSTSRFAWPKFQHPFQN